MPARNEPFPPVRAIGLGLLWLALFSLLDTVGEQAGAWPAVPLGRLHNLELIVGFLVGLAVLLALLRNPRRPSANPIG